MRVEKTRENLRECLCLHCPSYTTVCKMKNMPENLIKMLEPIDDIEHFEGMYCAFDRSHCIHEDKGCICEKCEVHKKYNLKKEDYCLKNGGM
ncbi:MAG: DUF2769 domain-containing protein [Alphaproteobacteria bacterium]|nr:DUF2769 domain-containing protein [Alphaproteobacteria bacterium]MBQ8631823.1 DUF2769 domain-containing protein [Alphaproteobacteria bacterium]MDY4842387.1 DUF2769 domain-containing protein [Alphaproteobacteria bacterium]